MGGRRDVVKRRVELFKLNIVLLAETHEEQW